MTHKQADVDFANRYRLEYVKHMMSISAGIFALSTTFMKDLVGESAVSCAWLLPASWSCLVVSLTAGIGHMKAWDRFYIAYRKDLKEREERHARINPLRQFAEAAQVGTLVLGVVAMLLFAVANIPS